MALIPGKRGFMREGSNQRRNLPKLKDIQVLALDRKLNRADAIGINLEGHLDLIGGALGGALGNVGQRDQMRTHRPKHDRTRVHLMFAKAGLQIVFVVLSLDMLDMGPFPAAVYIPALPRYTAMPDAAKAFMLIRQGQLLGRILSIFFFLTSAGASSLAISSCSSSSSEMSSSSSSSSPSVGANCSHSHEASARSI